MKPAPVRFGGWQDTFGTSQKPFELWHLTDAIAGYQEGCTLSRSTLEQLGYTMPPAPYQFGESAESAGLRAASADGVAGSPLSISQ